jgi:hypothetical protein
MSRPSVKRSSPAAFLQEIVVPLPEGTGIFLLPAGLTLLPLYTHPSVTPYQSNTPILHYHGRTVPGSRIFRDRNSLHEAFQIIICCTGTRTPPRSVKVSIRTTKRYHVGKPWIIIVKGNRAPRPLTPASLN